MTTICFIAIICKFYNIFVGDKMIEAREAA